jgi:hypothetical protein
LFVPSTSVAATTDRTFVIRVRGGKTEWVDVRTGLTSGPLVEVFGDLSPATRLPDAGRTNYGRAPKFALMRANQRHSIQKMAKRVSDPSFGSFC